MDAIIKIRTPPRKGNGCVGVCCFFKGLISGLINGEAILRSMPFLLGLTPKRKGIKPNLKSAGAA